MLILPGFQTRLLTEISIKLIPHLPEIHYPQLLGVGDTPPPPPPHGPGDDASLYYKTISDSIDIKLCSFVNHIDVLAQTNFN